MERYHMFKLGFAILFYAAYCIRPMMVNGLEAEDFAQNHKNNTEPKSNPLDFLIYYQGVEGKPGVDFPVYSYIPRTTFSCKELDSGYYADLDTDCQVFHICEEGKKISFLCPNGTIFQQSDLICEWWFKVNCSDAPNLYSGSAEQLRNDMARRKASRRVVLNGNEVNHGAVMRTEEAKSVTATKNGRKYEVRNEEFHANQAVRGGKKIDNLKIPQGNDLEQSEAVEESNNRHLANSQRNYYQNHEKSRNKNRNSDNVFGQRQRQRNNNNFDDGQFENYKSTTEATSDYSKFKQYFLSTTLAPTSRNHNNQQSTYKDVDQSNKPRKKSTTTYTNNRQNESYQSTTTRPFIYPQNNQEPVNNNFNNKENYQSTTIAPSYNNQNYQPSTLNNIDLNDKNLKENHQSTTAVPTYTGSQNYQHNNHQKEVYQSTKAVPPSSNNNQQSTYNVDFNQKENLKATTVSPILGNSNQNKQQSYNVDQNSYSTKQTANGQKTTLRDYHVQFSSTGSNFESSTQPNYQYSSTYQPLNFNTNGEVSTTTQRVFSSTFNNLNYDGQKNTRGRVKYTGDKDSFVESSTKPSTTNVPYSPTYGTRIGVTSTPKVEITSTLNSVDNNNQKSNFNRGTAKYNLKIETTTGPSPIYSSTFALKNNVDVSSPKGGISSNTQFNFKAYSHKNEANLPDFPKHKSEQNKNNNAILPRKDETDLHESQIPQESSSFVQSPFNSLADNSKVSPNNHKPFYSEVKPPNNLQPTTKSNGISSITPQFVTTQPINNGKPFLGSRVGSSATSSSTTPVPQDNSKETIIFGVIRHTTPNPEFGPPITKAEKELFNSGSTDKNLPPQVKTVGVAIDNPLPAQKFNTGNTDYTVVPTFTTKLHVSRLPSLGLNVPVSGSFNVGQSTTSTESNIGTTETSLPKSSFPFVKSLSSTLPPFNINVPESGSLNLGFNTTDGSLVPVVEPQLTEKFVSPLYPTRSSVETSPKTADHAVVYGSYVSTSEPPKVTVEVTKSVSSTPATFNQDVVPTKFDRNNDKIKIQPSKSLGGSNVATFNKNSERVNLQLSKSIGEPRRKPLLTKPHVLSGDNDYVRFSVGQGNVTTKPLEKYQSTVQSTTPSPSSYSSSGFFVTRDNFADISKTTASSTPSIQRPRGFQKSLDFSSNTLNSISPTFPTYKISSAKPFEVPTTTPTLLPPKFSSTYENVDNMINVLMEIAKIKDPNDYSFEPPRPGLVVPPSAGPQTLHTLAQYFANALDDIVGDKEEDVRSETKEKISALLTQMTVHGYDTLFRNRSSTTAVPGVESSTIETRLKEDENKSDDEATPTPELSELARNFSVALSSYLNDPGAFRKNLEELRPTEPPPLGQDVADNNSDNEELLNFSDADAKPSFPPVFPTVPSVSPTWGFIIANDVKNSLNPDLSTADTQSFVPRFNDINANSKTSTSLPPNHWTGSPDATKLWHKSLSVNPGDVNEHFVTTTEPISVSDEAKVPETDVSAPENLPSVDGPLSEVNYELRSLPKVSLNSTQVHGILIDFMNSTKPDESNRLLRILKKLNTSEEDFLVRMKEIESNPITKRLILLLISECGTNVTKDIEGVQENNSESLETLKTSSSSNFAINNNNNNNNGGTKEHVENSSFQKLIDPNLGEEDQDTRALQLLNSLYSIASKFGK